MRIWHKWALFLMLIVVFVLIVWVLDNFHDVNTMK